MKVSIIGAGNVGASTCFLLAAKNICSEIILLDIENAIAQGKSLDIKQSCAALNSSTSVVSCDDYSKITNSDIVVITAGSPRKPGMSREDLLSINTKIMDSIIGQIKKYSPNSIIIIVSNPLDVMTYVALQKSGFSKNKVIGMGGILDCARMSSAISDRLGYANAQVSSLVIGAHGEQMIPLPRLSCVNGVNLNLLFNDEDIEKIVNDTKNGGANIVKSLGTSAYYAPGSSVCVLIEAILKDTKSVHPCSVMLEGEYGHKDVCVGVPVVLGAKGIEKIIELPLNDDERSKLDDSVNALKEMLEIIKKIQ